MDITNTPKKDDVNSFYQTKRRFSSFIKDIRKSQNKTQDEFSEFINVNVNTYKTWENEFDERMPNIKTMNEIIGILRKECCKEYTFGDFLDKNPPKNKNIKYIMNNTGLNKETVNILLSKNKLYTDVINTILLKKDFIGALYTYLFLPIVNDYLNIDSEGKIRVNDLGKSGLNIQSTELVNTLLPKIQHDLIEMRKEIYPIKLNTSALKIKSKELKKEQRKIEKLIKQKEVEENGNNSESKE